MLYHIHDQQGRNGDNINNREEIVEALSLLFEMAKLTGKNANCGHKQNKQEGEKFDIHKHDTQTTPYQA